MTGKWTVTIDGSGTFDTGNPSTDADALAKTFLDTLRSNGQTVIDATFCFNATPVCKDLVTGLPK